MSDEAFERRARELLRTIERPAHLIPEDIARVVAFAQAVRLEAIDEAVNACINRIRTRAATIDEWSHRAIAEAAADGLLSLLPAAKEGPVHRDSARPRPSGAR